MPRPAHISDIEESDTPTEIHLATFELSDLVKTHDTELLAAYQNFVRTVLDKGGRIEDTYRGREVWAPMGFDALKDALRKAQARWDKNLRDYMLALKSGGSSVTYSYRRTELDEFARREGFEAIQWEGGDES